MKVGDTVRYLNAVGGGIVTRLEGRMAYVSEDGFETPFLQSDLVVVLPAGAEPRKDSARLMFDQQAFDAGRRQQAPEAPETTPAAAPATLPPAPETAHGDAISLTLAFEPTDLRRLSESEFNAVLVNDSNFDLLFSLAAASDDAQGYETIYHGEVGANELVDLASFRHGDLSRIERIALQAVALKQRKAFPLRDTIDIRRRLDLTKFHKLHCFRNGLYFDSPVLEFPLMKEGIPTAGGEAVEAAAAARLADKFRVDAAPAQNNTKPRRGFSKQRRGITDADNPNKVLPLLEIDLHIAELIDSTAGMSNADMLLLQIDTARRVMNANRRRIGQKIVFIHGKGDGVLRSELLKMLRREYPKAETQDASFREYGFGATLVIIH